MLYRISGLAIAAPRRVIGWAVLVMIGTAIFGVPVLKTLSAGGDLDPSAESSQGIRIAVAEIRPGRYEHGDHSHLPGRREGTRSPAVGTDLVARLQNSAKVREVRSGWTVPPDAASPFFSKDGKTGLIVAAIAGGESNAAAERQAVYLTSWCTTATASPCGPVGMPPSTGR